MSGDRPIFIVGTQRCGTTLLASVLGSHPNIVITPETTLLFNLDGVLRYSQDADVLADIISEHPRWPDFEIPSEMLRRRLRGHETFTPSVVMNEFYDCFRELSGKPRWGDNTPTYAEILSYIAGIWPDACVIHTFRDGRAVAASWFSLPWGPSSIDEAARVWKERIVKCRADSSVVRNFLEVRFEDLVVKLEAETREVCRFIEESFDDIAELALRCKFTDCGHDTEPGCAVRAAIADGSLAAQRLASWHRLRGEVAEQADRKQTQARRRRR